MTKEFFLSLLVWFLICGQAFGAVAFDAASGDDSGAVNDPDLAWTHTTAAGSNRAMIIACVDRVDPGSPPSVTVDGNAATFHDSNVAAGSIATYLFYRINQATGSNTMVATFVNDATDVNACTSMSFTGVHQTAPLGTAVKANGTTSPATVNLTIGTGELGVDSMITVAGTITVGSGQTQRGNRCTSSGTNICAGASTSATVGTEAMDWTFIDSTWRTIAAAVKAASGSRPIQPMILD